jgi:DNA repair exonuclease SbcCD ATPase subunit
MKAIIAFCLIALACAATANKTANVTQADLKAIEAKLTQKVTLQVKIQALQEREIEVIREITAGVAKVNKEQERLRKAEKALKDLKTPKKTETKKPTTIKSTVKAAVNATKTAANKTAKALNAKLIGSKAVLTVQQAKNAIAASNRTQKADAKKPVVNATQLNSTEAAALKKKQAEKLRVEAEKRKAAAKKLEAEKLAKRDAATRKATQALDKAEYEVKDATEDLRDAQKELNADVTELAKIQTQLTAHKNNLKKLSK